jgi:predicted dehydrogenase
MIKVALIGAGKMGISHLAILGAHPDVEVVGVADTTKMVTEVLSKYTNFQCFSDYNKMIEEERPDAVVVAVPTKYHAYLVSRLLIEGIHVFVEKPFCLTANDGIELTKIATEKNLVNQVGYHNKFIGTFTEAKKLIDQGAIGEILHFSGDMNGPVVIKQKQSNWRSKPEEGGGCLMDYAAHLIDLINYLVAPISNVQGAILKSFYSGAVEDSVFSLLETENHISGVINVNWSDETYRKMSTQVTIIGSQGKIIVDATELKVYLKQDIVDPNYTKGWNIKHINDFSEAVDFYLRGEEYSAQLNHFIKAVQQRVPNNINNFESAAKTDYVIDLIRNFKN